MREAIASYASRAAEKMRRHGVVAENLQVFMHTSAHNQDPWYSNGVTARFAETTNDTGEIVALALRLGERIWREGFRYAKTGIMVTELLPETVRQPALWSEVEREKRERAWAVVDRLNVKLGRGAVRVLAAGPKEAAWNLRAEFLSPRWTTRWSDIPVVKAGPKRSEIIARASSMKQA
jgi:DNA polymerase V